jgi:hypothetical protein
MSTRHGLVYYDFELEGAIGGKEFGSREVRALEFSITPAPLSGSGEIAQPRRCISVKMLFTAGRLVSTDGKLKSDSVGDP